MAEPEVGLCREVRVGDDRALKMEHQAIEMDAGAEIGRQRVPFAVAVQEGVGDEISIRGIQPQMGELPGGVGCERPFPVDDRRDVPGAVALLHEEIPGVEVAMGEHRP